MATHATGDALHEVILLFEKEGIWALLGPERSREMVLKLIGIGRRNDGSSGDILQDIGPRFQICAECFGRADEFRAHMCPKCYAACYEFTFKQTPQA